MKALCPFKEKYKTAAKRHFRILKNHEIGTHQEHVTPEEYRERVRKLFCQPAKIMVDLILNKERINEKGSLRLQGAFSRLITV